MLNTLDEKDQRERLNWVKKTNLLREQGEEDLLDLEGLSLIHI